MIYLIWKRALTTINCEFFNEDGHQLHFQKSVVLENLGNIIENGVFKWR